VNWSEGTGCNTTGNSSWINSGFGSWSGGTFNATDYGSFTASSGAANGTQYNTNVLNLINFWRADPAQNFGLIFVNTSSDNNSTINFWADEAPIEANRPQLIVTYTLPAPTLSTSVTNVNCNGLSNGSVNLTVTGGNPPFTYAWSNGSNTEDIASVPAGTYTVTVTNTGGGSSTASATVSQPALLNANVTKTNVTCFGLGNGTITLSSASGGSGSYQYRLNTGTWQVSNTFSGLAPGTYSVQIRDANNIGCERVLSSEVVTQPSQLSATVSKTNINCFGSNNGSITVSSPSGGSGSYQYRLNLGGWQSSGSFTGLTSGSYLVQIRDSNNPSCFVELGLQEVTSPAQITGNGFVSNVTCNGGTNGSITPTILGGTTPYGFAWTDGPTVKDRTNLGAGSYTLNVTDANGCTFSRTYVVLQPSALVVTPSVSQPACGVSGSIILSVGGGTSPYTYDWSDLAGSSNPGSRSSLEAGNYSVTITDANGCIATNNFTLNQPDCGPGRTVCITGNTSDVFSVTPDPFVDTYTWILPASAVLVSGQGTPSIVVDWSSSTPGSAQICVKAENVCGESSLRCENIVLKVVNATASVANQCSGGNLELIANGGTEYVWSGPNGFTTNLQNPVIFGATSAASGVYIVTVTDEGGCSATASVTVTVGPSFSITPDVFDTGCGQSIGAIFLTVSGGVSPYSYQWSNGATTQDIIDLGGGNYTVTVTDATGCTASVTGSVTDFEGPTLSATVTNVTCNAGQNGAVDLTVTSGVGPYSYFWSNGSTTQDISGLRAGLYGVAVVDAFGCVGTLSRVVNQPNPFQVNTARTNLSCFGSNDGGISLGVTGGTPGYSYVWSDGGSTATRTSLAAGPYSVTITDQAGCSATRVVILSQPPAIDAVVSSTNVRCNGALNGIITLTVSGGASPYSYIWSGPNGYSATTKDISGLGAGSYNVTITDANGCSITRSRTITEPSVLAASLSGTNLSCFGNASGSVNLTVSGGIPSYVYQWSNGATTEDISGLNAGNYGVLVTDGNGCTAIGIIALTQPAALSVDVAVLGVECFGGNTGSAVSSVSGGTGTYSYAWSDGAFPFPFRSNLTAGNYRVTVSDVNGCSATRNFTITQSPQIIIGVSKRDVSCNGSNTGSINLTVNGGSGSYQYSWSNGLASVRDQDNLSAGTYSVTVTDGLGCSQTSSITITQPSVLSVGSGAVVTNVSCFGSANGSVNITVTGGVTPYRFAWSDGQSEEDASNLRPGSYTVTVTDFNLCTNTASYSITEPDSLMITNVIATPNCASQSNGIVSFTVSGGTGPYSYVWTGSGVGSNPRINMSGVSSVTVTDARGCTVSQSFDLVPLTVSVTGSDVTCLGDDGTVIATVNGGVEPYVYLWSNGGTGSRLEGINVGTYSVTVTSGSCSASGSVQIGIPSDCLPPTAQDEIFTTTINVPISNTVMPTNPATAGYDSDPVFALSELLFEDITNAPDSVGVMVWDSINRGSFTFTPAMNFVGSFTWEYLVCNPLGLCDSAFVTINVNPLLIIANNDNPSSVNGYVGNTNVINAYTNDSFNGLPINLTEITGNVLTAATPAFSGAPVPSMNAGTGIVSVPSGTPAGTYTITYRICENLIPTNCDTAVVTVPVSAPLIDAVADSFGPINGTTGLNNVGNVYTNDQLNGSPLILSQITGSVVTPAVPAFSGAPVPSMNVTTGVITVPAGTPQGNYTITYRICENLNPTNCDQAVATIQVSAPLIDAVADNFGPINGTTGLNNVGNAYTNDLLNGSAVVVSQITGSIITPATPAFSGAPVPSMNVTTGVVSVPAGTPQGNYTITYRICQNLNPTNCDQAVITVQVSAPVIDAIADTFGPVNGASGSTNVGNAYTNDLLNGGTVVVSQITGSVITPATPAFSGAPVPSMNVTTGVVSVPAGTPQGNYTITYRICQNLNPTNCDQAVITVQVSAATIDAVADSFGPINGSLGTSNAGIAYTNDLLNGSPVVVGQITGSIITPAVPAFSGAPVPSMNVTTGIVSVPVGTPPANYTITYQICENLNSTNCDQAVISVQVFNAPPVAVNDSYSTNRDVSIVITPLVNDSDPDNNPISFTSLNGVDRTAGQAQTISVPNGSLQITAAGVITFVPNTGYVGTVTFPYVINDGNGGTAGAQVTIQVLFVNDPPTISQPPVTTNENTPVTFCPTLADPNVGDVLTLTICGVPTNGTASVNPTTKCVTYTPSNGYVGPDQLCLQVCDQAGLCSTTNVQIEVIGVFVRLNAKVLLQGSLINNSSELMRDSLRKTTNFPMTSPYGAVGSRFVRVANTAETMPSTAMLADFGANSIVDWIFVELRDPNNPAIVVGTRSGLLQRDGDIVDIDGVSPLTFSSTTVGSYYVSVKHRNHLGTMTAQPIALTSGGTTVDFTSTSLDLYNRTTNFNGFEQATVGTRRALWLGDTNVDGRVIFSGQNTDKTDVFNAIDQTSLNVLKSQSYVLRGYGFGDVNLDGRTIFAGQNNDITPIFNVVDSFPLNATFRLQSYVIVEQLP